MPKELILSLILILFAIILYVYYVSDSDDVKNLTRILSFIIGVAFGFTLRL